MPNKAEVLESIRNCERRILALEKERHARVVGKKHEAQSSFLELDEIYWKSDTERRAEKAELQQDIGRIRNGIGLFQKLLSNVRSDPAIVQKLKNAMEDIELSISRFKEKQREIYETLLLDEQSTSLEINAFEKRVDSWAIVASGKSESTAPPKGGVVTSPSSMHPAVVAFERFLQQTGGRQGGWDDFDHKAFLKIKMVYSGSTSGFVNAVSNEVPTKSLEEISQHDQWYTEYTTLMEKKRKAIEEWREQKKSKPKTEEKMDLAAEEQSKHKQDIIEKERVERFSKLSAWKEEKKQKQAEVDKVKAEKEVAEATRREQETKRKEKLKMQVQTYVWAREEQLSRVRETEEAKVKQEMAEKARTAAREIEMFRDRDKRALQRKKEAMEVKENEEVERKKQLNKIKEQVQVKASRDPSRLHKLTAGWEERKKAAPGPKSEPCLSLPRRAVPSWRQPV